MANDLTPPQPTAPSTAPVRANGNGHGNGTPATARTVRTPAPAAPAATTAAPAKPATPAPVKRKGGFWGWIILLVVLAVAAGAVYYFYFRAQPAGATDATAAANQGLHKGHGHSLPDIVRVVPATAVTGDMGVYLVGLGAVTPYNTVSIQARVSGQLMKVNFTDGQTVKQGDQLVQIDDRPYRAQLEQYMAQKEHDQALLDNANIDLKRYQTLWAQNSIPQQTLDTQVALVKQDQGTVDSDQALIDQTQLNIDYCDIHSPIDGVVGLRLVDVGNQVFANNTNLLVVNQIQPIYVDFTIPEDSAPGVVTRLKAGEKLAVEAYDRAGKTKLAEGTLLTTDNQIDPQTGTLKLRAVFVNTDNSLFANQFVNARLLLEMHSNVVLIPLAAIQYGNQGTFVYVIHETDPKTATVSMQSVKLGAADGQNVEITSGVAADDEVVINGVDKLTDGSKVSVYRGHAPGHDDGSGGAAKAPSAN
jgi:multidrug efflux system membrane fusion protein